ncbi:hypothetical protein QE152_g10075 [Popillia japonica]|uniref:Uncharacterized protein n=1 Tax=Popillia japonica TaxID=7064 RepID=A0AAW1LSR4_POPJA
MDPDPMEVMISIFIHSVRSAVMVKDLVLIPVYQAMMSATAAATAVKLLASLVVVPVTKEEILAPEAITEDGINDD